MEMETNKVGEECSDTIERSAQGMNRVGTGGKTTFRMFVRCNCYLKAYWLLSKRSSIKKHLAPLGVSISGYAMDMSSRWSETKTASMSSTRTCAEDMA